jgi:2-succinyl-5-enolpyruvyl-6-hydroxy-3-cyclohexene-1-carboxylate synthase
VYLDDGDWRDPLGTSSIAFRADPAATLIALAGSVEPAPAGWLSAWRTADEAAAKAFHDALQEEPFPNEPVVARATWQAAPSNSIIYAGSSMPIRDLDSFAGPLRSDIDVLANRGASGIDGLLSSAAGAAAAESKRVIALTGDVAALHDINALELIARESLPVTIVAVNNDGGGIFSFLPQAGVVDGESFDAAFAAPHGRSLAEIATAFGLPAQALTSPQQLEESMSASGPMLVEVHTDREENVAVHQRLHQAVLDAIST